MVKKSTHGLKLDQLAELLSIGIDEANFLDEISDDEAIADMLHERLITSLPKNASLLDSLMIIMGKMGYKLQSLEGKSLGDLLFDAQTDIGLLRAIKTYGKKLSLTVDSGSENAVAITIYHAAIASALVYHDKIISTSSYDGLDSSFDVLIEKKWMTPELKKLFSKACDICQEKLKEK